MADYFMSPLSRLRYAHFHKPNDGEKGSGKYEGVFFVSPSSMTPKDKARWKAMKAEAKRVFIEKFGSKAWDEKNNRPKNGYLWPFREGDEDSKTCAPMADDDIWFRAKTEIKPGIADARHGKDDSGKWPEAEDPQDAYSGCFTREKIQFYAYDNQSKGVAMGLGNVIIMKDGERLAAGADAGSDFDEIDDDELFGEDDDDGDDGDDMV